METKERLQKAINYIEKNLYKNITIEEVADHIYYSQYHFQRLFKYNTNFSIKDYILKRRLSDAASRLICTTDSVLDISLDNQFKNHESFTRAFKRYYNQTPSNFRYLQKRVTHFEKLNILQTNFQNESLKPSPIPRLITLKSFNVIGIEITTTIKDCLHYQQSRELWREFIIDKLNHQIPNKVFPSNCIGLCTEYNPQDMSYRYLIGYRVNNLSVIPQNMVGKIVPSSKYVVFEGNGIPDTIHESWHNCFFWKSKEQYISQPEKYIAFECFDSNWPLELMIREQTFDYTGFRMKEMTPEDQNREYKNFKMRVFHSLHGGYCKNIY